MTPSTPSASQKPGADEGMEDVKVQEEAKVPQSPQESPPRCSGCTSKLESLHERDRVIKTLRASLERERQARAQMESKFKATSDKVGWSEARRRFTHLFASAFHNSFFSYNLANH